MKQLVLTAIETRLERFRQKSRIQAGSLITTVFGDAILPRGGRVSLGSLIQLLQPLGVNERLVRTAVYRLVKKEWLQSEALGRKTDYMLTPRGAAGSTRRPVKSMRPTFQAGTGDGALS